MALSRRMGAFAGVVLFLSVLTGVYLLGESRGAHRAAKTETSASTFGPVERLERHPEQLNQSQGTPNGKTGRWTLAPNTAPADPFGSVFGSGDPFAQMQKDMQAMQQRMDAVFGQMHTGFVSSLGGGFGLQQLGMEEKDGAYVFRYQAPGLEKGSLKVNVDEDTLSISGEHAQENGGAKISSSFSQSASLPGPVDATTLKTEYKDGVLTVTVKKASSAGPRSLAPSQGKTLSGTILN